jgi:drug/metabolite transporter (DMT)-like permease
MDAIAVARRSPTFSSLGLVFVVLWSSAWIAGKIGLPYAGPFTLLLIRSTVAGAVFLLAALASGAPWPARLADYVHLAVAGALMQGLALGCAYLGLQLGVSAGISGLINGLAPLLTALGAVPFLGERIGPKQWLGLGAGLIGVALVVIDRVSLGGANWEGYAATFTALVALACGTLYQKKFCSGMDLRTGSFIQVAVASALVFVPALRFEGLEVEWNWTLVFASAWLSLVNSIGAFTLLYVLLRKGEASRVSALFYLVPPITAIMGFAAFHETLTPAAFAGFAITVGGVYLGTRQDAS